MDLTYQLSTTMISLTLTVLHLWVPSPLPSLLPLYLDVFLLICPYIYFNIILASSPILSPIPSPFFLPWPLLSFPLTSLSTSSSVLTLPSLSFLICPSYCIHYSLSLWIVPSNSFINPSYLPFSTCFTSNVCILEIMSAFSHLTRDSCVLLSSDSSR